MSVSNKPGIDNNSTDSAEDETPISLSTGTFSENFGVFDDGTYHAPYRAYTETTPQYIPGQGIARYMPSLRSLIPVRKNVKVKNSLSIDNVGFFSNVFYTWLSPLMYKAYRKGLTAEDIPQGSPFESCDLNSQRLELLWQEEVSRKGLSGASFGWVVWRFVRTRVLVSCLLFSLTLAMGFISPTIFMRKLLQFAESEDGNRLDGIVWALCVTAAEFMRLLFFAWNWSVNYRTGIRVRSACLALLYRKIIRLNSLGDKSIGELINIFANDSQRIFDMVLFGPMIIGGPLVTICGVIYIYWLLGAWALFGMGTFLLFYPMQYGISRLTSYFRLKTMRVSDQRIKLMSEILTSIKFIKMYAWEKCFSKSLQGQLGCVYEESAHCQTACSGCTGTHVADTRSAERKQLQRTSYCQSLSMSLATAVPVISAIVTFLAHIGAGYSLSAAQAFPVVTVFGNQLKDALSRIREGSKAIVDTIISVSRLKNIFVMEDVSPYVIRPIDKTEAVCIVDGTFAYSVLPAFDTKSKRKKRFTEKAPEREKLYPQVINEKKYINVLTDINFNASKGNLIGVCGPVGAGKTSLILACLGQIKKMSGQVLRDGSCAYVSQEAWILNTTLRENILFGETFEAKRYYDTVFACALGDDINMLPGGDNTEIGERGINLSGGQKQRIALARALYANRDIYLLDDPLSAVDAHVGAAIFNRYILTALQGKTVVFVTHQVQYLRSCSEVFLLKEGQVHERGTHAELMECGGEYAALVQGCLVGTERDGQPRPTSEEAASADPLARAAAGGGGEETHSKAAEASSAGPVAGLALLVEPEAVQHGSIGYRTYCSYVSAGGGLLLALLVFLTFLVNVGSSTFSTWWLAHWIKEGGGRLANQTLHSTRLQDNADYSTYQLVYALSVVVILATSLLRSLVFTKVTLRASTRLHNKLFYKILHSPMSFFEITPSGRIQNLFSRDMDEVDSRLPLTLEGIIQNMLIVLFAILMICLVFPWFIIPMVFLAGIYYVISKIFRVAVRDLKRMEVVTRSPIFSWVGTTVQGLSTIHAFEKENEFIRKFTYMFNKNSTCLYLCCIAGRWLAIRVDILAVTITCITAFLVILLHGQVPPALAYSAHISGVFQYTIRLMVETELRFISVERINCYLQRLVCEGSALAAVRPPPDWPGTGAIRFHNVSLAYRPGLPNALKGVSFSVAAGEKIGIVGRTGSGKSSLIVALFRLAELSGGRIRVDGIDIADITLEQLRSKLTVIPQDPVLFAGTIRSNVDPLGSFSDTQLWGALEKTRLKGKVGVTAGQLNAAVSPGGDNFSVGERQLLCLARALLKNARILVLDEATAAVDPETEAAIQLTIQREFQHCTVLTIAHRLSSVAAADRVLVMDCGQVMEFDAPAALLANSSSHFHRLCSAAEAAVQQALRT